MVEVDMAAGVLVVVVVDPGTIPCCIWPNGAAFRVAEDDAESVTVGFGASCDDDVEVAACDGLAVETDSPPADDITVVFSELQSWKEERGEQ